MSNRRAPTTPSSLGTEGLKLWRTLNKTYRWRPEQLSMVTVLCETRDRIEESRAAVAVHGAYQRTENGMVRAHPGLRSEKDAKTSFTGLWRSLGLDLVQTPEV